MSKTKVIAVNERGRRIGESHPRAKLTDHEIDLVRELVEDKFDGEGRLVSKGLTYRQVAEKMDTTRNYIGKIARCEKRAQYADRHKRVTSQ